MITHAMRHNSYVFGYLITDTEWGSLRQQPLELKELDEFMRRETRESTSERIESRK